MDNRQARRMMERMGMNMNEIKEVKEVVIVTRDKEIHLDKPSVYEIKVKEARVFQITAEQITEKATDVPKFTEEDVSLVMTSASVSKERAVTALEEANGDIALAILRLKP
ncbi:MAG TPA: nascent polypeptide-associated complex protein [Conexivisphaerales archaeon]|nr:nascent polypeptide-associated complex protein [Conexivisphaerales archaeon]